MHDGWMEWSIDGMKIVQGMLITAFLMDIGVEAKHGKGVMVVS